MSGQYNFLKAAGLANTEAPSLGELIAAQNQEPVMYCSSYSCMGNKNLMKGVLVAVGRADCRKNNCPRCGSEQIFIGWRKVKAISKAGVYGK